MSRCNKQRASGWDKTNTEDTVGKKVGKRLSLTPGWGQDGRIREVLQEIAAQVQSILKCNSHEKKRLGCCELPVQFIVHDWFHSSLVINHLSLLLSDTWFLCLIVYFLCRLKIKPWLPWVYSWIWHRCTVWYPLGPIAKISFVAWPKSSGAPRWSSLDGKIFFPIFLTFTSYTTDLHFNLI
jgi:hypothetical protein